MVAGYAYWLAGGSPRGLPFCVCAFGAVADNGTPISTLKELMGHSDIQTTAEFYLQTTGANEQRACQVLDQIIQSEIFESDAKMTPRPILGETEKIEKSINPHPANTYSNRGDGI